MIALTENVMRFEAKRGSYIKSLLISSFALPVLVLAFNWNVMSEKPIACILLMLPFCVFVWIYVDTNYLIRGNRLYYRSAFIRGTIDIDKIREITVGKTSWTGIRPATALRGLMIKFNSFDEIYISPESDTQFIEVLTKINNRIVVTKHE